MQRPAKATPEFEVIDFIFHFSGSKSDPINGTPYGEYRSQVPPAFRVEFIVESRVNQTRNGKSRHRWREVYLRYARLRSDGLETLALVPGNPGLRVNFRAGTFPCDAVTAWAGVRRRHSEALSGVTHKIAVSRGRKQRLLFFAREFRALPINPAKRGKTEAHGVSHGYGPEIPGARNAGERISWILSPLSGLFISAFCTHGSRRGLPSAAAFGG